MDTKEAGRLGGSSKSEKKKASSRENGKKGGRPKKINNTKIVNESLKG